MSDPWTAARLGRHLAGAQGKDVRVGGGKTHLRLGLIDELHIAIVPMLLGEGELNCGESAVRIEVRDTGKVVTAKVLEH